MAEFTVGLVLQAAVLYDLFQSVVLPRPAARKFQLARLIVRPMWWTWRWLFMRGTKVERTESRLAVFGPLALLTLFGVWGFAIIVAYSLMLDSIRDEFRPPINDILTETFDEWRKWSAMVLESHLAYPLLVYFRSSHDNEAWINSFGAVMDAAALVMTSTDDKSKGSAKLMFMVGNHFVEDITWALRLKTTPDAIIERSEYTAAVARMNAAGYKVIEGDAAWDNFSHYRAKYASTLNLLAQ